MWLNQLGSNIFTCYYVLISLYFLAKEKDCYGNGSATPGGKPFFVCSTRLGSFLLSKAWQRYTNLQFNPIRVVKSIRDSTDFKSFETLISVRLIVDF